MSPAPRWTPESKRFVFIVCAILIALAVWRFSVVLAPLIVAVIIAYLLNPLVNWVSERSRFRRSVVAAIIYIAFLVILISIPTLLAPLLVQQLSNLDFNVQGLSNELDNAMGTKLTIAGLEIDLPSLLEPITGSLDSIFSPLAAWAANLAVGIAGGFIWAIFIFVVGYYILVDANRFSDWVDSWVPPDYLEEFKQLRRTIDGVWKSYFIGQVTLAIIVGVTISVVTGILGIRSALILGLVAALLELIPNWGYGLSGAIGAAMAYFQGSTYIPLPNWAFALLVAGFYFLMWQVDTNYLVPRILGSRLQLPSAIIIIGIIAGASVGGALGLLLAAPTIATVKVLGSYIYRRLLDLEPYVLTPEPAVAANLADSSSPENEEIKEPVRRNGS
ncbi:MAG: AI-2E family transporter [Anaerolineales bacterium]|nr:AI-2E family transporter [Anaerolineales bacterium]